MGGSSKLSSTSRLWKEWRESAQGLHTALREDPLFELAANAESTGRPAEECRVDLSQFQMNELDDESDEDGSISPIGLSHQTLAD